MKILIKIFIIFTFILALLLTGSFIYLKIYGKDLIAEKIEEQIKRKVEFEEVFVFFPLTVHFKNLSIQDFGEVKEVAVSLSLPYLLVKQIHLSAVRISDSHIRIVRKKGDPISLNPPVLIASEIKTPQEAAKVFSEKNHFVLFVDRWIVENGNLQFFEKTEEGEKLLFSLNDVQLKGRKAVIPSARPVKTNIDLTALISGFDGRFDKDKVKLFGWADFFQKDMAAKLQVEGMDGQAGLLADLNSVNNDMTVQGQMSLAFYEEPSSEKSNSFEGFFVEALKTNKMQVAINFRFKTKMDDFQVGEVSLSGSLNQGAPIQKLPDE